MRRDDHPGGSNVRPVRASRTGYNEPFHYTGRDTVTLHFENRLDLATPWHETREYLRHTIRKSRGLDPLADFTRHPPWNVKQMS